MSIRLSGDPGNANMWGLAGFREEMTDGTGRLQSNLDSVISLESEVKSPSVVSDSLRPHRLYDPWNSAGKNTGVGSLSLLQGILQTQQSNPGLPHCRQILYWQSRKGGPRILDWVACPFCSGSGFLIQKSNCALLQCKRILHQLRYEGSSISLKTSF